MNENQIGTIIVDCAVELHRNLGPGVTVDQRDGLNYLFLVRKDYSDEDDSI